MSYRFGATKVIAVLLCLLTLAITLPFSPAETLANTPLGVIVTTGTANVGGNAAPTGASLFSGDKVVASNDPVPALPVDDSDFSCAQSAVRRCVGVNPSVLVESLVLHSGAI